MDGAAGTCLQFIQDFGGLLCCGKRACFSEADRKSRGHATRVQYPYAGVAQEFTELEPSPRTTCAGGTL